MIFTLTGREWSATMKFNKRLHLKEILDPLFEGLLNLPSGENAAAPSCVNKAIEELMDYVMNNVSTIEKESNDLDNLIEEEKRKGKY